MRLSIDKSLPDGAKEIRHRVFVEEQGFQEEFDDVDGIAVHLVMYGGQEEPVATCRVFLDRDRQSYVLGRLAVIKEYRGRNLGSVMVKEAEKYVKKAGGTELSLHAQCRAAGFYRRLGYEEFGEVEEEQGCPHIWMRKALV